MNDSNGLYYRMFTCVKLPFAEELIFSYYSNENCHSLIQRIGNLTNCLRTMLNTYSDKTLENVKVK